MGKELLIMRHAKSSWKDASMSDHDRPLNERGLRDAPKMAQFLSDQNLAPDLVLTSSANRAHSTSKIVNEVFQSRLEVVEDFYLAAPDVYIDTVSNLSEEVIRPMVVGHNPGLEYLVNVLTGLDEFMSTAAVAHLTLPIDAWPDLMSNKNGFSLQAVYRPKELDI